MIEASMTGSKEWMRGELRTASAKVSEDIEQLKEAVKAEVASQKHDLEERFNQSNDQMVAALQKVAQVEGGLLPTLELRFNKFEATLAQMDALILSLVATTSAHAELLKSLRRQQRRRHRRTAPKRNQCLGLRSGRYLSFRRGRAVRIPFRRKACGQVLKKQRLQLLLRRTRS